LFKFLHVLQFAFHINAKKRPQEQHCQEDAEIFPYNASIVRLICAVLMERNDGPVELELAEGDPANLVLTTVVGAAIPANPLQTPITRLVSNRLAFEKKRQLRFLS
jgi:hypothetical protein